MKRILNLSVLIAALGYFVDMFDITIFGVVRMASLTDLGITDPAEITSKGLLLLNLQAFGMLLGGILWGVLGDKKGRLSVLFGSILLYSLANILNAFVSSIEQYAILRFIAGVGLAGELGAAITLVSETLSKEDRGYGTAFVAAIGILGAVTATIVGQAWSWRTTYVIGGTMGLLLLLARFKMADSTMFAKAQSNKHRGDLRLLFTNGRFPRYLRCILIGIPVYYSTGILLTLSPEISKGLGLEGVTAGNAILLGTIGLTVGDLTSGLLSQKLRSRKRAVYFSFLLGSVVTALIFLIGGLSTTVYYSLCFILGLACGYWAVLVTIAAEQFGTNIRATVATTVPNFVRATVILLSFLFSTLKGPLGVSMSAFAVGVFAFGTATLALMKLSETFGKDLDFVE